MTVRYNAGWGVAFVVLGAAATTLGLWVTAVDGFQPAVVAGMIVFVLGVLYLTRPYFEYHPTTRTVVVKSPLGPVQRRFGGSEGQQLIVEGNRIVCVRQDGKRRRPVSPMMANGDQWRAVLAMISQHG